MAQDGNWQAEGDNSNEAMRAKELAEKLGKLSTEKASWQRHEYEREAKVRRQHSLEQAAGIVKSSMDWQDDGSTNSREAGRAALELADRFYRWVDTGQLPTA